MARVVSYTARMRSLNSSHRKHKQCYSHWGVYSYRHRNRDGVVPHSSSYSQLAATELQTSCSVAYRSATCLWSGALEFGDLQSSTLLTERRYRQILGVAIAGVVFQNGPARSAASLSLLGLNPYAMTSLVGFLYEPLRTQLRIAFAQSLQAVWIMVTALAALGLVASLFMQELTSPLHPREVEDERRRDPDGATPMGQTSTPFAL